MCYQLHYRRNVSIFPYISCVRLLKILSFVGLATIPLLCSSCLFAQSSLSLSSLTVNPSSSLTLGLSLSESGTAPTGLQWTLLYPASQVSAISATAGSAATQAGKKILCAPASGSLTCLVTGLNATTIAAGAVANIQLTLAPEATTTSLSLVTPYAVAATGKALSSSATGGVVTVPAISSLVCNPGTVNGGGTTTCTATLSAAAPSGGSKVTLTSNNTLLTLPASVTVASGATSASFTATAAATISSNQSATVTATLGASAQTAPIDLQAPLRVSAVACNPASLGQSGTSTCTVTLTGDAPAGGSTVTLSSNNTLLTVPASVTVSAGAAVAAFSATASSSIATNQTATITAAMASGSAQASISLTAPTPGSPLIGTQITGSATLPPSTVNEFSPAEMAEPAYCGNTAATTVTMNNPAGPGGVEYQFCAILTPAGTGQGAAPAKSIVAQFSGSTSQFSGSTLTIQVSLGTQPSWTPFQLTFSDPAFAGLQIAKYNDNFLCSPSAACGVTSSLSATTITISGGVPPVGGVFNASFTLTSPASTLSLLLPGNASLLPYPTVNWDSVANAQLYTVWAGGSGATAAYGPENVYESWQTSASATSLTLPLVPMPSSGAFTLWDEVNGNWTYVTTPWVPATTNLLGASSSDPAYQGSVGWESLIYPLNGATNVDPYKAFTWQGGNHANGSTLIVGTSPGASNLFNSGTIQDTQTIPPALSGGTLLVPGLQPNTTYYARLTGPPGSNTPTDISFTTGVGLAHLIYPADYAQQVATASLTTFTCNSVQGALQYVLWLGSTPGGNDVMVGWPGLSTSLTIQLYPNHIYYARMWTQQAGGNWEYVDTRFSTYTTNVAFVSFPANGELHATANPQQYPAGSATSAVNIGWQLISDATGYTLWVGTTPGAYDAANTYVDTVTGNVVVATAALSAQNSTYYVRLWTQKGSNWYFTDSVISTYPQTPGSPYGAQ